MPGTDISLLIDAALAAGDIAKTYFKEEPEAWDKGDGQGPVTEADLAIDRMLKSELLAARSDYGWLSEETDDDSDRLTRDRVFIVDPIDGTRAFMAGHEHFAHSLAIAENGEITAAVVHLPIMERTYVATKGGGATMNGVPIAVNDSDDISSTTFLANKANMAPEFWRGGVPPIKRSFRPSLAYRVCLAAEGRYHGMLTLRPTWEWDVAAGSLILSEAGGASLDGRGHAPLFNQPHPQIPRMIAAGQTLLPKIMERLILLD